MYARVCVCIAADGVPLHSIAISFETAVFQSIIGLGHHYEISNLGLLLNKTDLKMFTNCPNKVCRIMFHVQKK